MDEEIPGKRPKVESFLDRITAKRFEVADSIENFPFNKKRVKMLTDMKLVPEDCKGILYWMFRDGRVQDNWAFLFAQKMALKNRVPLHVCYCILPTFLEATIRHYNFLVKSLREVAQECNDLNINFHLLHGEPHNVVFELSKKLEIGLLVADFFPLRLPCSWLERLQDKLNETIPICQVDAHNIVPCWIASDKLEYGARTVRPKINKKLGLYLSEFPPLIKHPYECKDKFPPIDWSKAIREVKIDMSEKEVSWAVPGYKGGIEELESFLNKRLKFYHSKRNDPLGEALSNLSPWFHFGMIAPQRAILQAIEYKDKHKEAVAVFMEEAIIRRELSDNFCYYNEKYDSIDGAYNWAIETLNKHRSDKRENIYNRDELEKSLTHDDLWNAAQKQLVVEGKMHGFLRMYWAKKILEWTKSPEEALEYSIYLNDRYSMDGRDPNGYVGCMWSICGIHDQGWREREIFGKIRYMNYKGCERKFNVKEFVAKWGTKAVIKKKAK
ncbi:deoxyribodipyrimidine photo-lyase [Venturia canescens]|uniref:deoxyribodipyrimidine photo-lyase n=1 Tax=Venturia canescens TaxID=32260 RepID=UPI001C9C032E|nr:deoxyribodipyrimidine photo-lyase [Venturia canescens]XP_043283870.1 deoxyribodipyrimidine photo-lyase [Venturia canescens]